MNDTIGTMTFQTRKLTLEEIKGLTDRQIQELNTYYAMRQTNIQNKIYKNSQFWFYLFIASCVIGFLLLAFSNHH